MSFGFLSISHLIDFRLKRESNKMSTAEMLALLALLETNERNNNRPISDADDANLALYYRMMLGNTNQLQDDTNDGEWANDFIEPSVQYYGNPYGHIEQNPRDRRPFKGEFLDYFFGDFLVLTVFNFDRRWLSS